MEARQQEESGTAVQLLEAAERCLRLHGLAGLSTRQVAEEAGMPLSQIHYHFGSKQKLLLALLKHQNRKLLARQEAMYAAPMPLWRRWMKACDYLEEDLASGYVRVLHEMIAAGWSNPGIAAAAREIVRGWYVLLVRVAEEAARWPGGLGGFSPREVALLAGSLFSGTESMLLLDALESRQLAQSALRKIGEVIRAAETRHGGERDESAETGP